jgi:hypothetical protein
MVNQINYDWESTNVMLSTGIFSLIRHRDHS